MMGMMAGLASHERVVRLLTHACQTKPTTQAFFDMDWFGSCSHRAFVSKAKIDYS